MTFTRSIFIVVMLFAVAAHATTRYVSPSGTAPYQTIQSAVNASVNGDTVLIGPGIYPESISFGNRLTIIGAGWDQTRLTNYLNLNSASNAGSVVEGIHFQTGNTFGIVLNTSCDSVTVRRCRFETSYISSYAVGEGLTIEDCLIVSTSVSYSAEVGSTGRVVYRNCLFVSYNGNSSTYAFSGVNNNLEIYNCVFLGYGTLLNCTGSQPVVFVNNIVYDWIGSPSYGTYLAGSMFDYNASDQITPPGTHALLLTGDPFVNYDEVANYVEGVSDLHPAPGSPIINAGIPDIIDLDATVSDLGIYGGPRPLLSFGVPSYPFAIALTTTPTLIGIGDTVQVNTSGRVGPRY